MPVAACRDRASACLSRHAIAIVLFAGLAAGGCATDGAREGGSVATSAPAPAREAPAGEAPTPLEVPAGHQARADEVERAYVVGPGTARRIGYRVDWQHRGDALPYKTCAVSGDSVFLLDEANELTRLTRETGHRMWRVPVADPLDSIFGVTYIPAAERVYLMTGSYILVIEATSGERLEKQRLEKVANTAPVQVGEFFVYGARNGELVWHQFLLDSFYRGYAVASSIQLPPVRDDGYVVAIGNDGRVMCLRADSASAVWSRRALAPIVAPPVAGNGAVYVASQDQKLRAYELAENRAPLWEYLTESPLEASPVLIDDRVYQQVDSEGLVCLEARPDDAPGGVVVWRSAGASGNVVTQIESNLLTWDRETHRLVVVDARLGAVVDAIRLESVDHLVATDVRRGELYAAGADGRIVRLVPAR